jgi:hypothetical protein
MRAMRHIYQIVIAEPEGKKTRKWTGGYYKMEY